MNIVYAVNARIPSRTANSINVMKMCEAFKENSVTVELIVPEESCLDKEACFDYYGIRSRFVLMFRDVRVNVKRELFFLCDAVRYVKKKKNTILYLRALNGALLANLFNVPHVLEIHHLPHTFLHALALFFVKKSAKTLCIAAISKSLRDKYMALGIPPEKIIVLPDAATVHDLSARDTMIKQKRVVVGYTGHLYAGRGVELLLALAAQMPEYSFQLWGGHNKDIDEWNEKIKANGLGNVNLNGFIEPGRVHEVYSKVDMLLMPYQKKVAISGGGGDTSAIMSPLKMFEYMASGKPLIASNLPVLREILRNEENALLVEADSVEQWKAAIVRLAGDASLSSWLADNARSLIREKYTWKKRAKVILDHIATREGTAA